METFIELNKILNDIKNKGFIKQEYLDSGGAGKGHHIQLTIRQQLGY